MKSRFILAFVFFAVKVCNVFSQKPLLDTSSFSNWPSVDKGTISNDGNYVVYAIQRHYTKASTLIIQDLDGKWKTNWFNARDAEFTNDNRNVIFIKGNDTLSILSLGSSNIKYVPNVNSFKLYKQSNSEWIAYHINSPEKQLVLLNFKSGKQLSYFGVDEFIISGRGNTLVYKTITHNKNNPVQSIHNVNLFDYEHKVIWEGVKADNVVLNNSGDQLAFVAESFSSGLEGQVKRSFWYYQAGMKRAKMLVDNKSIDLVKGFELDGISHFSQDGRKLFVTIRERRVIGDEGMVKVDLWSYTDPDVSHKLDNFSLRVYGTKYQSGSYADHSSKSYASVVDIVNRKIIRLQQEHETISWQSDNAIGVTYLLGDGQEAHWNSTAKRAAFVVSTTTGERVLSKADIRGAFVSSNGKFVAGLSFDWSDIYSIETMTGSCYNMTQSIPDSVANGESREGGSDMSYFKNYRGLLFDAWLDNNEAVLAHDDFDIWRLDPEGKKPPINLTNGYGKRHHIVFRISVPKGFSRIIPNGKKIIITAFNAINKNNGFYKINLSRAADPEFLIMSSCVFETPDYELNDEAPLKARDKDVWLIKRSRSTESPNYFWTKDFKSLKPISDIYPEKNFDWLTAELVHFTKPDGDSEQGVLYKPENLNRKKKYPVILHYYESKSQELNKYQKPGDPNGDLDIPWFVNRGYLVFLVDIHYKVGEPAKGTLNSVIGAVNYLEKLPWVDSKRAGIQGHSFGGYETNMIIANSRLFAAAVSSSGPSDLVSWYGGFFSSYGAQPFIEVSVLRTGETPWQIPNLYIENSPFFQVHKITTPLLMVSNVMDRNAPFTQGLELFTAMRRLGKKVWMLQYEEGGHGVRGKEYADYVIRMTQFFDHYLKDALAPVWMTRGIPAKLKGTTMGYEIDTEIKTPPESGLLNAEEKQKLEALKHRKPITITFE